jgi:ribosome-associated protein
MIEKQLNSELNFYDLRSQGPGGQNVNKLNTKIELRFNIHQSKILNEEQKI